MYRSVSILNMEEDRYIRFTPPTDLFYARHLNIVPITFSEVRQLCCDFPLAFVGEEKPLLAMITGIDAEGKNLAIDDEGKWRGKYLPAFLKRYPFTLVEQEGTHLLGFDLASGCFNDPGGEALFDEKGNPTAVVRDRMAFLEALEREMQVTRLIVETLEKHDVLKEAQLRIGEGEEAKSIGGFRIIDEERMSQLEDSVLADWSRKGWLELLSLQKLSLGKFDNLLREDHE